MSNERFRQIFEEWRNWCQTADTSENGWATDFPGWHVLVSEAELAMLESEIEPETLAMLEECWAGAEESEELLDFATERVAECWAALTALAASKVAQCRWQVYVAVAAAGSGAAAILRRGMEDSDSYARRRAALALASISPPDAGTMAVQLMREADPFMRMAAIEMAWASNSVELVRQIVRELRVDSVECVRLAAEKNQGRIECCRPS
jgi:HEAT repeat protein